MTVVRRRSADQAGQTQLQEVIVRTRSLLQGISAIDGLVGTPRAAHGSTAQSMADSA